MKQKTKRYIAIGIAFLIVFAILAWIITAAAMNTNAICLFGHNYGEDGKCIRCGADKPIENEPETEQKQDEEPQSLLSFSSGKNLMAEARSFPFSGLYRVDYAVGTSINTSLNQHLLVNGSNQSSDGIFRAPGYDTCTLSTDLRNSYDNGSGNGIDYILLIKLANSDTWYYVMSGYYSFVIPEPGLYNICLAKEEYNYEAGTSTTYSFSNVFTVSYPYVNDVPPAPTKLGYTFTGWYTDEACTELYTDTTVTSDITLYAGFRANTYSIKFNANGGSGEMANESMTYDQSKALTANGFTKEHYIFKGWATSADGDVFYQNEQSVQNLTADDGATIELFAKWQRSEVSVTFVADGNTIATNWFAIGTNAIMPDNPIKEGYNFVGWFYDDGTQYTNQTLDNDITLTANFAIIRCVITFIVDGEVYALYECDWGTKLADALSANNVNPVLMEAKGDEYSANF